MAAFKTLLALWALSCCLVAGAREQKIQDESKGVEERNGAVQPVAREASHNLTTAATNDVVESSSDQPRGMPAKARSSLETPKGDDKPAASSKQEDEHKMASDQIIELARERNNQLEREQTLVDQKLIGRDILKDVPKVAAIDSTEGLIKYIVSLAVPDVLKALLPQNNAPLKFPKGPTS